MRMTQSSPKALIKALGSRLPSNEFRDFLASGEFDIAYDAISADDELLAGFYVRFMSLVSLDPDRPQLVGAKSRSDLAKAFGPDESGNFNLAFFKAASPFRAKLRLDPDSELADRLYDAIQDNLDSTMFKAATELKSLAGNPVAALAPRIEMLMSFALPGTGGSENSVEYMVSSVMDYGTAMREAVDSRPRERG